MDQKENKSNGSSRKARTVILPCGFDDKIYSIIAEKEPHELEIEGFQVTKDEIFIVTGGMYIKTSQIGTYYFLDKATAEYEMKRKREEKRIVEVRR